jgi:hypothetical protein
MSDINIRKVVDQYHENQAELKQWMAKVLDPQIAECKTIKDWRALRWKVAQQFGGNAADYRFPSIVTVHFAIRSCEFPE